jgi:predicted nuclease of restriction endonuclease-like RecB superfamily
MATVNTVVQFDAQEIRDALFERARKTLKREEGDDGHGAAATIQFDTDADQVKSATVTFHRNAK